MDVAVLVDEGVRLIAESDLDWMVKTARKRYPSRFDIVSTSLWIKNIVLKNPLLFFPARTTDAFAVSMVSLVPWFPNDLECNVVLICADDGAMWQASKLLRSSVAWARSRKCRTWKVSSENDYDLGPMARRVGASEQWPRYVMEL